MTSHSDKVPTGTLYTKCMMCNGTGYSIFQGIKRPCGYCFGNKTLPMSRNDGEGWVKK